MSGDAGIHGPLKSRLAMRIAPLNTLARIRIMITRHLIITGRVQGVGYRNYMAHKAHQFDITGWVRNRNDGSVEAAIQGSPANVEALIQRAHRGPPKAAVSGVQVIEVIDLSQKFTGFETRPTA